jgi:quercetin dioxygenase-like cupin family protein
MRISTVPAFLSVLLLCALQASAQTRTAPDPGVNPVRQIDRAEVRVTRVELQPGAVRSMHTHDDVRFHLFIPIQGKLELTIGSAKPVEALPGQAFFMERGTPHGFRNAGTTPAAVMEVFVKDAGAAAGQATGQRIGSHDLQALLQTVAALEVTPVTPALPPASTPSKPK